MINGTPCAGNIVDSRLKELLPPLPVIYVKAVPVQVCLTYKSFVTLFLALSTLFAVSVSVQMSSECKIKTLHQVDICRFAAYPSVAKIEKCIDCEIDSSEPIFASCVL